MDLRSYWNTRAAGHDIVFWDSRDPRGGPFRAAVERRIERGVVEQEDAPEDFRHFPCYVAARSRESRPKLPPALRSLIEAAGLSPIVTPIVSDVGIANWIHRGIRHLPSVPDERVVAHTEDRGEDQSRVTIELPRTPLAEYAGWTRQELGVQIEAYGDTGYRGTLKLPYLPDLNNWYRWNLAATLEHLRVQDDAFAVLTSILGPTLAITPLPTRLLLEKLFERAGIAAVVRRGRVGSVSRVPRQHF